MVGSARFAVPTKLLMTIPVFWYTVQPILAYGYQRFGGACHLHLQGILALKVEAESSSNTLKRM